MSKNPHNICTWDEQVECESCSIQGELHCKWDKKILNGFYATSLPPIIIAIFGILGTNDAIDFQNDRLKRYERDHQKWLRGK